MVPEFPSFFTQQNPCWILNFLHIGIVILLFSDFYLYLLKSSYHRMLRRRCLAPCLYVTLSVTHITTGLFAADAKTFFRPCMNCVQLWDICNPADRKLKNFCLFVCLSVCLSLYLFLWLSFLRKIHLDILSRILIKFNIRELEWTLNSYLSNIQDFRQFYWSHSTAVHITATLSWLKVPDV
jgi:hypothetical protein